MNVQSKGYKIWDWIRTWGPCKIRQSRYTLSYILLKKVLELSGDHLVTFESYYKQ